MISSNINFFDKHFDILYNFQEDWAMFMITKKRTTKLKMTEFDEAFSEDHADGTEVRHNRSLNTEYINCHGNPHYQKTPFPSF